MEDQCKLLVRSLPPSLADEDIQDLMKHFGAEHVVCFGKKGRMRNSAFVSFASHLDAEKALKRLHQLEILGCMLRVEYANKDSEKLANIQESRKVLNKTSNIGSSKKRKNNENENKEDDKDELPTGIAPKLGVHHKLPGHLSYLYPSPTVAILTNIANALASVPRFYTQVLHLMNKMNLPPPFTGPTVTPPLPDDTVTLIDAANDTNDLHLYASSEESELESDAEDSKTGNLFGDAAKKSAQPPKKKKRLRPANIEFENPKKQGKQQQDVDEAFEQTQQVTLKRIEFKLAANIAATVAPPQRTTPITDENTFRQAGSSSSDNTGFGVFEPSIVENDDEEEELPGAGEDFVSLQDIHMNKIPEADLKLLPQMKNYERGQQSSRLYIKNLAKQTEDEDLKYLFKRFLYGCSDAEQEIFDIRLMKEGRMKEQAFVTFPTEEMAVKAVNAMHGYSLYEKPMLIQFGRAIK